MIRWRPASGQGRPPGRVGPGPGAVGLSVPVDSPAQLGHAPAAVSVRPGLLTELLPLPDLGALFEHPRKSVGKLWQEWQDSHFVFLSGGPWDIRLEH